LDVRYSKEELKKTDSKTTVSVSVRVVTVPAFANAGSDCDPYGGHVEVIAHSQKERTNVLVY
jgi:hypothetical protein